MKNKGKQEIFSFIPQIFTSNEQKLCTKYRELIGMVYRMTKYELIISGSDICINVPIDHKPIFGCFTKIGDILPTF